MVGILQTDVKQLEKLPKIAPTLKSTIVKARPQARRLSGRFQKAQESSKQENCSKGSLISDSAKIQSAAYTESHCRQWAALAF